jgi:hypothetical protein
MVAPNTPVRPTPLRGAADLPRYAAPYIALFALSGAVNAQEAIPVSDPSMTTYGEISPSAPQQLRVFSFLVGKWEGKGKAKLPDGTVPEFPVTWIGRYILGGSGIADEMHSLAPDGSPYLGISFRQYDSNRRTWIIEYLNVSGSFIRKQVNAGSGSVEVTGRNVRVTSESPGVKIRENYLVPSDDRFTYRLDVSRDGGRSWNESQITMDFRRVY